MSLSGEENTAEFDLRRIKNSRAQIKSELTRFQSFLDKNDLDKSIGVFQVRYENSKNLLDKFKTVQSEYEELLLSDFPVNYKLNELEDEREEFESRYFQALATAHSLLDKYFLKQLQAPVFASALGDGAPGVNSVGYVMSHAGDQSGSGSATLPNFSAKLPSLTLI